ncbi:hypothetical protein FT663_00304 [Candidozyma haemuli var. vulneris]|nr:hypothetical protein FT662_00830 [[Candida] haemuloni var. vulneris]KAF3995557.1 hypothetical protein FT663_00304 [[Candida] haemuloni var. vulneris]
MKARDRKPAVKQQSISSFFANVPAKKPLTTPEKVVAGRSNSRLSAITSTKGAFDEFGSSDTSFGSPEMTNFSNPLLSKLSRSDSTTGSPERPRSKFASPKEDLFVVADSDDEDKENNTPRSTSPVKQIPLKRAGSSNLSEIFNGARKPTKRPASQVQEPTFPPREPQSGEIRLSDEQRAILEHVIIRGENVFFTGSAGTGKSVVLRYLVQALYRKHGMFSVGVTASTGLAACNIGGQTLHKYLCIGLGTGDPQELAKKISRKPESQRAWKNTRVLIIDEISMIDAKLFSKIDQIAKIIRKSREPFGGMQLVCTGDFFQLPPVSKDNSSKYCFKSLAWKRGIQRTITLTQVFRQKGDTQLIDMLNALRHGDLAPEMVALFHSLSRKVHYTDGIEPTELFPTRQEVKRANEWRLHRLPGKLQRFHAIDNVKDGYLTKLYDNLMCEQSLDLKTGSQVMFLKNHDSVVNGSIGTVLGFMPDSLWSTVGITFGFREAINPCPEYCDAVRLICDLIGRSDYTDEQRAIYESLPLFWRSKMEKIVVKAFQVPPEAEALPIVMFKTPDGFKVTKVDREDFTVDQVPVKGPDGKTELMKRTQLPLLLAWAMSIHKAQGQSIDRLRVDLRKTFEKGQVYVALSRATSKDRLEILNFDHRRISVSDERKCDGQEVCKHCRKYNLKCERPDDDNRSIRLTTTETQKLRGLVSSLQGTLSRVHNVAFQQNQLSNATVLEEIRRLLQPSVKREGENVDVPAKRKLPVSIGATSGGSYSIFGPTSAFYNLVDMSNNSDSADPFDNMLMNSSSLITCLENFFKYQYPDIATFIHRESFLNDFLHPSNFKGYCSEELIYAIAALGAKCSDDDNLRSSAGSYFETSKSKIFSKKICVPHVNTLQALLCLSLYELGDGNASASWMLSGMAFRMGYDLGFQLNPQEWAIEQGADEAHPAIINNMDVMVRSRVYWGCFVFDHFVSLLMGRPVTVRKSEATIPSSEHLPNSTDIDNFIFQPTNDPHSVANIDASQSLVSLCSLSECIGSILSEVFSKDSAGDDMSYLTRRKIQDFNSYLEEWRSKIPTEMRWNRATLKKQNYNPTSSNFRLYYYILVLCLNRPFMNTKIEDNSSHSLCNNAVSELAICLDKFNMSGLPPSILVVYSSILGISVALLKIHSNRDALVADHDIENLKVYYTTISRSCQNWKLATRSLLYLKKKIAELGLNDLNKIFESAAEAYQESHSQADWDHLFDGMDANMDWALSDNVFSNFFDFLNTDDVTRVNN